MGFSKRELNMCQSKDQYDSKPEALKVAKYTGRNLKAYMCPICQGYHLTSENGKYARARRRKTRKRRGKFYRATARNLKHHKDQNHDHRNEH